MVISILVKVKSDFTWLFLLRYYKIAKLNKGQYFQDEFAERLSAIFQGTFPTTLWSKDFDKSYTDYCEDPQNVAAREIIQ